jgi:hypothetical protein
MEVSRLQSGLVTLSGASTRQHTTFWVVTDICDSKKYAQEYCLHFEQLSMDLLSTIDTRDSLFIPESTTPTTLPQQPIKVTQKNLLNQNQRFLNNLLSEKKNPPL